MRLRLLSAMVFIVLLFSSSRAGSYGQQYIVTLKGGGSINALNRAHGTKTVKSIPNTSTYLISGDDNWSGSLLNDLQKESGVELAEPDSSLKLQSTARGSWAASLSNAMASLLDGHTLTTFFGTNVLKAYVEQPALTLSHISDVRDVTTGAGTRIAYIDTGVDPYHPALRPWLDPGVDLLNNSSTSEFDGLSNAMASLLDNAMASLLDNRFIFFLDNAMASLLDSDDDAGVFPPALGHGTAVAGILHVVAPNARIVPIKAFDVYGNTTMFRVIQGVYTARDLGVDVLNMSFSTSQDSVTLRKALIEAAASGVAIVASAGNDGSYQTNIYPASYSRVIGVGATDFNDHIASFSNYGSAVSLMAPGAFVVTTVPGGRYAAAWGTSFSSPIVGGTLALMASARGHGHSDTSLTINTADNIDSLNPGFAGLLGKGRVDAKRALKDGK